MTVSVEVAGKFKAEYNHDTEPGVPADVAPAAYLQDRAHRCPTDTPMP